MANLLSLRKSYSKVARWKATCEIDQGESRKPMENIFYTFENLLQ